MSERFYEYFGASGDERFEVLPVATFGALLRAGMGRWEYFSGRTAEEVILELADQRLFGPKRIAEVLHVLGLHTDEEEIARLYWRQVRSYHRRTFRALQGAPE